MDQVWNETCFGEILVLYVTMMVYLCSNRPHGSTNLVITECLNHLPTYIVTTYTPLVHYIWYLPTFKK
jgi:hypothetical protein